MIIVLKHGNYKLAKCSCGCEFSFDAVDVKDSKVTCPECFVDVAVTTKTRPEAPVVNVPTAEDLKGDK